MALLKIGDFVEPVDVAPVEVRVPEHWCLVRTHPNRERTIADKLLDRGIAVYLPKEVWSRPTAWNKRRLVELPIFAGIVFVSEFDANLRRLRGLADGIVGYVMFGERVAVADRSTMADIHRLEARLNLPMGQRKYSIGQRVRVVGGPFRWWEGPIEQLDSDGRLKVLLHVLGRQVSIPLDETQIEPV